MPAFESLLTFFGVSVLLGLTPGRSPKFVKPYADLRAVMTDAVQAWAGDVVSGEYPDIDHSYS